MFMHEQKSVVHEQKSAVHERQSVIHDGKIMSNIKKITTFNPASRTPDQQSAEFHHLIAFVFLHSW